MEIPSIPGIKSITVDGVDFKFPDPLPIADIDMQMEFYYRRGTKHYFRGEGKKMVINIPKDIKGYFPYIKGAYYNLRFFAREE